MVSSRTATALAGLAASLLASLAAWWYFETIVLFLFLPLVPLLFRARGDERRAASRTCPTCGFQTTKGSFDYCPRDGTRLE